jgi:regulatory protein
MANKAYNYSIYLLSRQDYSVFKITQKLRSKEYSEDEISQAIDKLKAQNYLREEEYIRSKIKSMLRKGYSNSYIQRKLSLEELTIDHILIDTLRDDCNLSPDEQISDLINKKLRNKEIPNNFPEMMKFKNKIISYLIARGFSYQDAKSALDTKINQQD